MFRLYEKKTKKAGECTRKNCSFRWRAKEDLMEKEKVAFYKD